MRTLATKQPIKEDSAKQGRARSTLTPVEIRSNTISPLSTGMPLIQRQCACGGGCPRCQDNLTLQPKLKISEPGDVYEQEADRVADQVMRMPEPSVQRQIEPEEEEGIFQREAISSPTQESDVPSIVHEVLHSPGQSLDSSTRTFMESRFGNDFSQVQVHTDPKAANSAQAVKSLAYTVGRNIVFAQGQYAPTTSDGKQLIAHELAHVLQQGMIHPTNKLADSTSNSASEDYNSDKTGNAMTANHSVESRQNLMPMLQRRPAPYIKKITVHLAPSQHADLEWEGTPPAEATGSDSFTVSTGKGYSDPGDPRGTCTRTCCNDPETQCAPPWNQPGKVGACCTYYGNTFWTGTPLEEHNGWKWWTPIQPYYSSRGIALHEHNKVTGEPIGHGCVRMDEPNAKRIYDFSNGRKTNVTIVERAAPVACDEDRRCTPSSASGSNTQGLLDDNSGNNLFASEVQEPVAGLEGEMS